MSKRFLNDLKTAAVQPSSGPLLIIPGKATDQQYRDPENQPVLNLKYRHFTHRRGPFDIIGSWFMFDRQKEPCLVILRAGRDPATQTPCIVRMQSAWLWAEPPLGDMEIAVAMACDFARYLGLDPFRDKDVLLILSTVRSRLEDLVRMPPAPPMDRVLAGDVRFRDTEGVHIEREVWDNA